MIVAPAVGFCAALSASCLVAGADKSAPAAGSAVGSADIRAVTGAGKPDIALKDLKGAVVALSEYRGRPVLVHFFATWCEPCRPEMRSLARLARRLDPETIGIVAVSVAEPAARVRRFFEAEPAPFPILLDDGRVAARGWDVSSLPTTFLLDSDLVPRFVAERDLAWDEIDLSKYFGAPAATTERRSATEVGKTARGG